MLETCGLQSGRAVTVLGLRMLCNLYNVHSTIVMKRLKLMW